MSKHREGSAPSGAGAAQGGTVLFLGADAAYLYSFRRPLIERLIEKGYQVVVLATALEGFRREDYGALGDTFYDWPMRKAGLNPFADLKALKRLWDLLRRHRPDIIFAHTIKPVIYGMIMARAAAVPRRTAMIPGLGYAFMEEGQDAKRRVVRAVATLGYRVALSQAHTVVFQNKDDRQALVDAGALAGSTPTGLVNGSGVDMQRFAEAPLSNGPPTFLMVARLLRDKGVYEFVEAARRVKAVLPEARFILAGAADTNPAAIRPDEVEQWVREAVIEAPGYVRDPAKLYSECHVFVLPSYREGTPRTNLEAMATGRAIITTDAPGCRETVTHGENGFLVPPKSSAALADAMLTLARNPDLIRSMGKASRRYCHERFELRMVAEQTVALIEGKGAARPSLATAPA